MNNSVIESYMNFSMNAVKDVQNKRNKIISLFDYFFEIKIRSRLPILDIHKKISS